MKDHPFTLEPGTTPLVVSVPHCGRRIPEPLQPAFVARALDVEDTDWYLDRLYAFVRAHGASLVLPRYSRYVIDLNRPPEDTPMYPGSNNTGLCPTRFFTGEPLYREGCEPDAAEIERRIAAYWRPYHGALADELARLKREHGYALLFDVHSIKAELPWLFEGRLPDLNLGTADGASCAHELRDALARVLADQHDYSFVVDGRFKGGTITRRYGRPAQRVHAAQLEMCWHCYLGDDEQPPRYDEPRAARVRPLLERLLRAMLDWKPA